VGSYFEAIAHRDVTAARSCLTSSYRRQLPTGTFGYFGTMQSVILIRATSIQERSRPAGWQLERDLPKDARLVVATYIGRWHHPFILGNGIHAVSIWLSKQSTTTQWRIVAEYP